MYDNSIFDARFTIDGVAMDATPSQILSESPVVAGGQESIVDESVDPTPVPSSFDRERIPEYIDGISSLADSFPLVYPEFGTVRAIASTLTDILWNKGHFKLGNVGISLLWKWNGGDLGNMTAFYESVSSAGRQVWDIGIKLDSYSFEDCSGKTCSLVCGASVDSTDPIDDFMIQDDEGEVFMENVRMCPSEAVKDDSSWIVYVPFDTCPFRLGGSFLSCLAGNGGDSAPKCCDPDYFRDCFEVIRELVEDGVAISGTGVGRGGLVTAAASLCRKTGLVLDIGSILQAYNEQKVERVLFGEIPGVLIQIRDSDFDYIDSQFLLQDVAYYTLGHPVGREGRLVIRTERTNAVSNILESLVRSIESSEGED